MNEQEVRSLLDDLAATPAPPPRVDVSSAVTAARRQTRVRTWTSIAAASVLVVGLAAGVTYVVSGGSPEATTTTTTVPSRSGGFDPLVRYVSFGWLPEADKLNSTVTSISDEVFMTEAWQYVTDPDTGPMPLPAARVILKFYGPGIKPASEESLAAWGPNPEPSVAYAPVSDAPAVNGAQAYWVTVPDDPERIILKWHYAPNAWAELSVARIDGDLRESAHRIATELRFGGTERMLFPFHLTNLPAGLRPTISSFSEGGADTPWDAALELETPDRSVGMKVTVEPMEDNPRAPNTTVDGHPADRTIIDHESKDPNELDHLDMLEVYDIAGLKVRIVMNARSAADAEALLPDGAAGLFRALTVHPDHADWTDQPLR